MAHFARKIVNLDLKATEVLRSTRWSHFQVSEYLSHTQICETREVFYLE
jgi:hypothetical protein